MSSNDRGGDFFLAKNWWTISQEEIGQEKQSVEQDSLFP